MSTPHMSLYEKLLKGTSQSYVSSRLTRVFVLTDKKRSNPVDISASVGVVRNVSAGWHGSTWLRYFRWRWSAWRRIYGWNRLVFETGRLIMFVEIGLESKGFIASFAIKIFESRMGLHVSTKIGPEIKKSKPDTRICTVHKNATICFTPDGGTRIYCQTYSVAQTES